MTFFLFLLVNATLFIRPAEIVPSLIGLPIYNVLISACLVAAAGKVLAQLTADSLRQNPLTVCVLGTWASIIVSHLARFDLSGTPGAAVEFGKVVLYYLLLVGILDTPTRLRRFLVALAGFIVILTVIALLQYHGIINLETLSAVQDMEIDPVTGEEHAVVRMCSTGIYNDPNDLCLILLTGMGICLYGAGDRRMGPLRVAWLAPLCLFGYALTKTHSKGGFISLSAGMMVVFQGRFGTKRALILGALAFPVLLTLFAGRQTSISMSDDSGQSRFALWAEGFAHFKARPLFGIGEGTYADEMGQVAHNSYVHAYTELGLLGGVLFVGAFYYAIASLQAAGRRHGEIADPEVARLISYLTAMVVAYAVGILGLSRNYVVPTYMILGLVASTLHFVREGAPDVVRGVDGALARRFAAIGVFSLIVIEASVRYFVHG